MKVYKPADSLQVYFETGATDPVLVTAIHLRIYVVEDDK